MKGKTNLWIVLLILFGTILSSCEDKEDNIALEEYTLSNQSLQLGIGEIQPITAIVMPDNTTNPNLNWVSNDETVAIIQYSDNGLVAGVKGIALGNTTLTATSVDGG